MATEFGVHEPHDPNDANHVHPKRPIVAPPVAPTAGMDVVLFGARSGRREATVKTTTPGNPWVMQRHHPDDDDRLVFSYEFPADKHFVIDQIENPSDNGDSGSPVLWEDANGNYRLVGIFFASRLSPRTTEHPNGVAKGEGGAVPALLAESLLQVTFGVKAPTAIVSTPIHVAPGTSFELNGSSSVTREDGATITKYQWFWLSAPPTSDVTAQPTPIGGFPVEYPEQTTPNLTISGRSRLGEYVYRLVITDSNGAKASDTVTVDVTNPPTANAGADKTAFRGQTVTLVGSGTDPDGDTLTYQWKQLGLDEVGVTAVTAVTINNADQATANFVAPNEIGALSFELTVTDSNEVSHSDTVDVTIENRDPISYAGPDKLITAGYRVTLEGSVSDPDPADRGNVAHTWTQDGNNPATVILAPVADKPFQRTFTPTITGAYQFTLTATDPHGLTAEDEVQVRVLAAGQNLIPTNLTATPAARSVGISWTGVSIATGYEVQLGEAESGEEIGFTTYTTDALTHEVEDLKPQTRYYYRVRAMDEGFVGPWSRTESVVTHEETAPPRPTPTQWEVRHINGKVQVRVTEHPIVYPAVSQVQAKLSMGTSGSSFGLGSLLTTVTKTIGATLNEWVDVLTPWDMQWRTGTWTAQVRFRNKLGRSSYSTGKTVTVTGRPPIANAGRNQTVNPGSTVTLRGSGTDPDGGIGSQLSYSWTQTTGEEVALSESEVAQPHLHRARPGRRAGILSHRHRP